MNFPVDVHPDEFTADAELNLGRANGNIFHRKPGLAGVHDGQVMVRLKKKRFVVLDYSIQPTEDDYKFAEQQPHVDVPKNAGRTPCLTSECTKIGVPVCLYDSEPHEPKCLYVRNGLCFECQRILNEKRRTERKRKRDVDAESEGAPPLLYAVHPVAKYFKLHGGPTVHLKHDAIIVNGSLPDIKAYGGNENAHHAWMEIGPDMQMAAAEAASDTSRLVEATLPSAGGHSMGMSSPSEVQATYDKAFTGLNKAIVLLAHWKNSWDLANESLVADTSLADAVASAAAVAAVAAHAELPDPTAPPDHGAGVAMATTSPSGTGAGGDAHHHHGGAGGISVDEDGSNMMSLLLAADNKRKDSEGGAESSSPDHEDFGEV